MIELENGESTRAPGSPLQFGLKVPLVLMLGMGLILAVYVAQRESGRRRRLVLEEIISEGGWVKNRMRTPHNPLSGPPPRRALFASDSDLQTLAVAHVRPASVTNGFIDELSRFHTIEELSVAESDVDDSAMSRLSTLTELRYLYLADTQVGFEGCAWLQNHPALRQLDLRGTPVNDQSLARVASLPRLEALWLDRTHISDDGLQLLSKSPQLAVLGLAETRITDRGLQNLRNAKNLMLLDVASTAVRKGPSDPMPMDQSLRVLKATKSQLNDSSSTWLSRCSQLELADLSFTLISDEGMRAMQLPSLVSLDISESRARGAWLDSEQRFPMLRHLKMTLDIDYEDRLPAFYRAHSRCLVQAHRVVD